MDKTLQEIVERGKRGERFAVALLTHVQGSAPQKAGARLLVLPNGEMRGTIGGGCLEMEARRRALSALQTGTPELFELRLDDDFGWDDGLICGGKTTIFIDPAPKWEAIEKALAEQAAGRRAFLATCLASPDNFALGAMQFFPGDGSEYGTATKPEVREESGRRLFVEPILPRPTLIVMGCGHIGGALVQMASTVGFDVIAIDDRADYANKARLPGAKQILCDDMTRLAAELPSGPDTYWVIVTRGHRNDGKVLAQMINRPSAFVGMIGSRRKVRIIKEGLIREGITTPERLNALKSPVGLDIGAQSPEEIALSIAAQLVAVRHGKV